MRSTPRFFAHVAASRERVLNRSYTRDKDGKFSSTGGMSGEEFDRALTGARSGEAADTLARLKVTDPSLSSGIDDYGRISEHVNGALRTGGGDLDKIPPSSRTRDILDRMDEALADCALPSSIVVKRGVADSRKTFGGREPAVGTEWTDHGFVSTTTKANADKEFTGDSGIEMRILVPKGTKGFSNTALDPGEVVLDRGLSFRVVRDNGVDPYYGTRQLDVEIVGARA